MLLPQRTARSLGMMVAAIVTVAAVCLWSQQHTEAARDRTAHSLSVLLALEEVSTLVKEAETNQRGYLLTDEQAYRERYAEAVRSLTPRLAQLEELTRPDPVQHARVLALEGLVASKTNALATSLWTRTVGGPDLVTEQVMQTLADAGRPRSRRRSRSSSARCCCSASPSSPRGSCAATSSRALPPRPRPSGSAPAT
jgi:CHASE3 domain sensor protein